MVTLIRRASPDTEPEREADPAQTIETASSRSEWVVDLVSHRIVRRRCDDQRRTFD